MLVLSGKGEECVAAHVELPANGRYGFAGGDEDGDLRLVVFKVCHLRTASLPPSQGHPFRPAECEGFLCPQGDELPLDLRHESEGEAEDFAVNGVVEGVAFLYAMEDDAFPYAFLHDDHDVGECPAESRDFGDEESVSALHAVKHPSEFTGGLFLLSADDLCHPFVDDY